MFGTVMRVFYACNTICCCYKLLVSAFSFHSNVSNRHSIDDKLSHVALQGSIAVTKLSELCNNQLRNNFTAHIKIGLYSLLIADW